MRFTPTPRNELSGGELWPDGIYDFEVIKAEEKISGPQSKKPGSPYTSLSIKIFNKKGEEKWVNDVLAEGAMWKVANFCDAVGLSEAYDKGELVPDMCKGRTGQCQIVTQKQDGYDPRNAVKKYVVEKEEATPASKTDGDDSEPVEDDDVPF